MLSSKEMTVSNQKSKFQDRSESFKEVHNCKKGVFVKNLNCSVKTNKQVCILDPIKQGEEVVENEIVDSLDIDFGMM